ncbi:MAG: STAS domain-containing protein [Acidimicrobiia bacterium]
MGVSACKTDRGVEHANFETRAGTQDDEIVIVASGEIDLAAAVGLRAEISAAVGRSPDVVVVDLADAGFIDSSGIDALVRGYRSAERAGIELVVQSPSPFCRRALEITTLNEIVKIRD